MEQKYQETLNYLFSQLPMFQRVGPMAFKKDLTNTLALVEAFGHPQNDFPSIHIAGTNGKGSTAHMLAAILQKRGFKTGLYTSPHYRDFRERIKINGQYISKNEVIDFVQYNKALFKEIKPSFFEISVALAFYHFSKEKVDIAIIETGLGGRLDSTNIITPLLSVITNISFDHMNLLGNTLPEIAGEKAGIIKSKIPVIIGENQPELRSVFIEKAKKENSPIYFADEYFSVELKGDNITHSKFDVFKNQEPYLNNLTLNLHGAYQTKNLLTAIQTIEILDQEYPQFNSKIEKEKWLGLSDLKGLTNMLGRWEIIGQNPTILCDSAHNPAGLSIVISHLNKIKFEKLHMVLGFVSDKSLDEVLKLFPKKAKYYFAKPDIPRGTDAKKLMEEARVFGLKGRTYVSVKNALKAAKRAAKPNDLIYVGGSIFVVAEVI
ncbi:MAG: bifunctional folylpolyglutamate synthase/dihydrofolate synthase [Saprospiraceae bacterium]|jgi:dihydrofolate synthase/folylpolyglutamate synthase|nr:bifunctional folylpolyglutamate synthase/dihydrofolate synthase [Saprospiraceae bacterium]